MWRETPGSVEKDENVRVGRAYREAAHIWQKLPNKQGRQIEMPWAASSQEETQKRPKKLESVSFFREID